MSVHKISGAFFKDMQVEWPCPECGQKTLQIIAESFVINDTYDTNKHSSLEWFEPEMHRSIFSCMARCSRRQCGEVVACSGVSGWEQLGWDDATSESGYYQWYHPKTFYPSLHPFQIPNNCPEEITEPLQASFSIFLMQPGAAATLIRISVEKMLTAMGVEDKKDNGFDIGLKDRLKKIPLMYQSFTDHLNAIKFIGDAGSHNYDKVKIKDIEDAYEIMEYVINDLFSGRKESAEVLIKRLSNKFER
ncbi:DUF4145 domain-containing protein [Cronobacter sakazakii]